MKAQHRVISHVGGNVRWELASASMTGQTREVQRIVSRDPGLSEVVWENCCSAAVCRELTDMGIPLTNVNGLSLVLPDKEVTDVLYSSGMSPVNSVNVIKRMIQEGSGDWKTRKLKELEIHLARYKKHFSQRLVAVAGLPQDVSNSVASYLG